jgi:hypothetical protein
MGLQIEDGIGRGYSVEVTPGNALRIRGSTGSFEHAANHTDGVAFNTLFSQTLGGTDDCIYYMLNSDDKDLVVEGVTLYVSGACEIYFKIDASGTRNSASAITPANLSAGSGKSAQGTFEQGADLAGGAATLSGGTEFERLYFTGAAASSHHNFEQDVILQTNHTLTIWSATNAVSVAGTVVFNYHDA